MNNTLPEPMQADPAEDVLDPYSQIVTSVAERLTPQIAALYTTQNRAGRVQGGAGSAVVSTDDGFLVTNAHVGGSSAEGTVAFATGRFRRSESSEPTRSLIWPSSGLMAPHLRQRLWATPRAYGSVSSWLPSATRSDCPAVSRPEW